MQVISSQNYNDYKDNNTCLAIGAFDGLHKGHQLIIKKALKEVLPERRHNLIPLNEKALECGKTIVENEVR